MSDLVYYVPLLIAGILGVAALINRGHPIITYRCDCGVRFESYADLDAHQVACCPCRGSIHHPRCDQRGRHAHI